MAKSKFPDRDGTNQTHRSLPALQTDYVAIDEHDLKDHLALAHAFARELKYFDFDNVETGDWQGLLNPDELDSKDKRFAGWLQQIEDFIQQPENFTDDRFDNLHRPHFVLYLTFLQLLGKTQRQLNQLTARHLDFYFRKVLGFEQKPPRPDRVNILLTLSSQVDRALLPAGTLLEAGKDSGGKELVYHTDSDLVVSHAGIARLCSVYVNMHVIDIRKAREQHTGTKEEKVMAMLSMALGDPAPGDALPSYLTSEGVKVDYSFLKQLQTLVKFVSSGLFMELGELRSLIALKNNRGPAADSDWTMINSILTQAGKTRAGNGFTLKNSDSRDRNFDDNLKDALGVNTLTDYFATLPLVKNITDLYQQNTRQDVQDFIPEKLYLDLETFTKMMKIKVNVDNEWEKINTLLERAGKKKSANYTMAATNPPDFEKNFTSALGTPAYPKVNGIPAINDLDSFYKALLDIEAYFYMTSEDFISLMEAAASDNPPDSLWLKVYDKLAAAHQKKISSARKAQITKLCTPAPATADGQKKALIAMMQLTLGALPSDTGDLENDVNRIKELLPATTDLSLLDKVKNGDLLTDEGWENVCSKLELAWRNRVPIPAAQKSNWLTLSAFNDTLTANVQEDSNAGHWHLFGQRQPQASTGKSQPPPATLGWAISSPILNLAQGKRTVTLSLVFKAELFNSEKIKALLVNKDEPPFRIELSTPKGWVTVHSNFETGDFPSVLPEKPLKKLCWTFTLDQSMPAISALPDADNSAIKAPWPILKLLLQPRWDTAGKCYVTDYSLFQVLLLEKVLLDVEVEGLSDLQLQNDDHTLPSGKPFEPFGSSPALGSRLYFGHSELMLKKLTKLDILLQWMGVPEVKLNDYYLNYTTTITDNSAFKCKIALVDQRMEMILTDEADLFDNVNATAPAVLSINQLASKLAKDYRYERQLAASSDENVTAWSRYWFLELSGCDFQHAAYPGVAAANSIKLAAAIANNANAANDKKEEIIPGNYKVNPPYTPKLKSLSITYKASIELKPADLQNEDADRIYHLHPFGYAPIQVDSKRGGYSFLPAYDNEGELYIGLSRVQAPQTLSILLQMAEGTANPDLEAASVQWSVLNGNRWLDLDKGQLQDDATNGLLQTGIIKLQLDTISPSTLLPSDLYWLRIAIANGCDSVCDCVGIDTQAVTATFIDQDNSEDHLNQPLPANTIKSLVNPISAISSVRQPYTSFGANPKEQSNDFNTRVSERLRHKQRAVSYWDYEHLVLEQFPEIYKAKCIPAGAGENPGQVTVVVIPDVRNRLPFNPFEPKAPAGLLGDIKEFLSVSAPLGAHIQVKNACYLAVKLRFAVRFQPGCDSGFYIKKLNEDVNRFLSPWAYEQGKDVVIGGKIYANAIIDFIERCAYVDYVAHFKLFLDRKNDGRFKPVPKPVISDDAGGYAVTANRPDAVLVAARSHEIDLITEINYGEQTFTGINYMKLDFDFIVG
ncbi:MAG: baseplate J/gp47 family protein [Methylobacter sp.]